MNEAVCPHNVHGDEAGGILVKSILKDPEGRQVNRTAFNPSLCVCRKFQAELAALI